MHPSANWLRHPLAGVAAGAAAVALVTGAVAIFEQFVPVLSLGVLYVFAVLPIAVLWGTPYGVGVAIASMLAFNFLFLPPRYSFTIAERSVWFSLAVYLTTAIVVGGLASGARRRRDEAVQREREAALLADVAAELLRGARLEDELDDVAARAAGVLGVSSARIELDAHGARPQHQTAYPLTVDRGSIGTLYTPDDEEPRLDIRKRLIPALAVVLAIAREQERLEQDSLEAETLRRTHSIKTAVLQAVSHDLRTPLATIEQALDGLEVASSPLRRGSPSCSRRSASSTRASSGSSTTSSTSRGCRPAGPRRHPSCGRRPSSSASPRRARVAGARRGRRAAGRARCERRRGADPARAREPARERARCLAAG